MIKNYYLIILFLLLSSTIYSQSENEKTLNELEITAIRKDLKVGQSKQLLIITKKEIELLPVHSVDDLLAYLPGIDIRKRGANGVQADVSMRGGSFDQVLILLNGVNITDPQTGHYNLDLPVDLADVERIEILQGAAMRTLGPNAFSGAINIVTRKSGEANLSLQSIYGSNNFVSNSLSGFSKKNTLSVFASANYKRSDGYKENTDFDIKNAYVFGELKPNNKHKFEFQAATQLKSYGANQFYSFDYPNQFENTKTFLSSVNWNYKENGWELSSDAYWRQHHDRFELFRNFEGAENYPWYTGHNYHQTDLYGVKSLAKRSWKQSVTSFGADWRNENIRSTVLGDELKSSKKALFEQNIFYTKAKNRIISTLFANQDWFLHDFLFSGGASLIHTDQFGTQFNGGLDVMYKPSKAIQFVASANSTSRLPTFTDLYYQSVNQKSNPDLQAEKAMTYELSTKYQKSSWNIDLSLFYRNGENIIDWIKRTEADVWESANLTSVDSYGFDFSTQYIFENSFFETFSLDYSYLSLNKKAVGFDSQYALDYLKNKFVIQAKHKVFNPLSINWSFRILDREGEYFDFIKSELTSYKPVSLLDVKLRLNYPSFLVFGEINNLLNQQYVEFGGIEQEGINFNVGISVKL